MKPFQFSSAFVLLASLTLQLCASYNYDDCLRAAASLITTSYGCDGKVWVPNNIVIRRYNGCCASWTRINGGAAYGVDYISSVVAGFLQENNDPSAGRTLDNGVWIGLGWASCHVGGRVAGTAGILDEVEESMPGDGKSKTADSTEVAQRDLIETCSETSIRPQGYRTARSENDMLGSSEAKLSTRSSVNLCGRLDQYSPVLKSINGAALYRLGTGAGQRVGNVLNGDDLWRIHGLVWGGVQSVGGGTNNVNRSIVVQGNAMQLC